MEAPGHVRASLAIELTHVNGISMDRWTDLHANVYGNGWDDIDRLLDALKTRNGRWHLPLRM